MYKNPRWSNPSYVRLTYFKDALAPEKRIGRGSVGPEFFSHTMNSLPSLSRFRETREPLPIAGLFSECGSLTLFSIDVVIDSFRQSAQSSTVSLTRCAEAIFYCFSAQHEVRFRCCVLYPHCSRACACLTLKMSLQIAHYTLDAQRLAACFFDLLFKDTSFGFSMSKDPDEILEKSDLDGCIGLGR